MSRRDQITMTTGEIEAFLREQRVVIVASNGADGWPHLMPLWFVVRGDELWAWTYGASQKVKNLERDARATRCACSLASRAKRRVSTSRIIA